LNSRRELPDAKRAAKARIYRVFRHKAMRQHVERNDRESKLTEENSKSKFAKEP
jgi:hypothetical protein